MTPPACIRQRDHVKFSKIVPFIVFEVSIFTKVLKRQDSDKTPKEQLPKMLLFDLTRLSQIFFFLSISWNFDTLKF